MINLLGLKYFLLYLVFEIKIINIKIPKILIYRLLDGRREHHFGPANAWTHPDSPQVPEPRNPIPRKCLNDAPPFPASA
jgi:hypothetical protein